ncbi:hypothetical protein [Enterobacter phage N5822]|nr:hypothetical protein [Enterobacter phage N5822]
MKSREYRNINNDLVYWLENESVMVRHPVTGEVKESSYSAMTFFIMVGSDVLVLIEEE